MDTSRSKNYNECKKKQLLSRRLKKSNKKDAKGTLDLATTCSSSSLDQCNKQVQVSVFSYKQEQSIQKLEIENDILGQQNIKMEKQIEEYQKKWQTLSDTVSSSEFKQLDEINKCADDGSIKAIYLVDQINNFDKRQSTWSEVSLEQCQKWREASWKGYVLVRSQNLLSCPSRRSIDRFAKESNTTQ